MRQLLSRSAIGALALVVTVALAGCDDDDGPESAPPGDSPSVPETSSPSEPSTTPTATGPVEPTLPSEAQPNTKAGAEAFVDYYWEVVNFAQTTGDTDLLRSLSVHGCNGCNGGIRSIDRIYRRGGQIVGGEQRVISSTLTKSASGSWAASITLHIARQTISGAGDLDQTSNPGNVDLLIGLNHQSGSWFVTYLGD